MWRIKDKSGKSISEKDMWWHNIPDDFVIDKFYIVLDANGKTHETKFDGYTKYGYQKFTTKSAAGGKSYGEQFILVTNDGLVNRLEVTGDKASDLEVLEPVSLDELTYRKDLLVSGNSD